MPSDFDDFQQNEDNKSFHNLFIATRTEAIDRGSEVGCVVYIIKANTVINCKDWEACHMYTDENLTLEEADNRIICHIGHMIKADILISIKVRSADTDVIVILLEFMPQFKLWNDHIRIRCDFGTGVNRKATSINLIYERLGKALFFHVFSGCESIWMSCAIHKEVSWVFQLLSWLPNLFYIDTCTPTLEFISYVYTKNPDNGKNINEVKRL